MKLRHSTWATRKRHPRQHGRASSPGGPGSARGGGSADPFSLPDLGRLCSWFPGGWAVPGMYAPGSRFAGLRTGRTSPPAFLGPQLSTAVAGRHGLGSVRARHCGQSPPTGAAAVSPVGSASPEKPTRSTAAPFSLRPEPASSVPSRGQSAKALLKELDHVIGQRHSDHATGSPKSIH